MLDYSMKHAYLIMAHHEFEVLGKLVQALDDERNDIYIHFDKKVKTIHCLRQSIQICIFCKSGQTSVGGTFHR